MKKEQLERDYGLRCGQHIQDAEGIMYLICNDLLGNVSFLRIRDSVLFSGLGVYEILERLGFEVKGNSHSFKKSLEGLISEGYKF